MRTKNKLYFICIVMIQVTSWALWGNISKAATICPGIESLSEFTPEFTETERILLCGKSSLKNSAYQAWAEVPLSQASLHLRAFLESRGYLNPQIKIQNENHDQKLVFNAGPIVRVKKFHATGAPHNFDISRRRRVQNEPLTPSLLSNLEAWSRSELQEIGYPCPVVKALAQTETGEILVQMQPGPHRNFGPVQVIESPGFRSEILRRYDAFRADQDFNIRLLQATEDRILSEGLADQVAFANKCTAEGAPLHQLYTLGPPRIFSLSISANTEVIAEIEASLRHVRLGQLASFWDVRASASARLLELSTAYKWYFADPEDQHAIRPLLSIRRQDEKPFLLETFQSQLFYLNQWDIQNGLSINFGIGPEFQTFRVQRGLLGGQRIQSTSLQSEMEIRSYKRELYRQNIYEGLRAFLALGTQSEETLSDFTAETLRFETELLRNLRDDSPPSWIGGWRLSAATTSSSTPERLPPTYRQYLGGFDSLRGFGRLQLPSTDQGGLTRVSNTFEIRTPQWNTTVMPLAFIDLGWLGDRSFQVESRTYKSPGVGIYWRSALGPIRASLAFGEADGDLLDPERQYRQWQIFASFGERF